jgi:uncharacterized protein YecE (DUF72 family)
MTESSPEEERLCYRLGLPAWAFPGWQGAYFRKSGAPLAEYARVFNTVEGNTSFYRIPSARLVASWREAVAGRDFRFCFKLPRTVTHEREPDFGDLATFLRAIEPLGDHLGPLLVQFPARFGPDSIERIETVLEHLPSGLSHALEVRHPAFFGQPECLDPLLERHGGARITMDTRALYQGDLDHPEVRAARHEKPDLPVIEDVHDNTRFLRLVLHPSDQGNEAFIEHWAGRVAGDLEAGRCSYVFIHCPNNLHCPAFAQRFHRTLARLSRAGTLPPWPSGLP